MRQIKFYLFCTIITISLLLSNKLHSQNDVGSTVALSEKLNELGMIDLSFYLIDKEIRNNPGKRDRLMIQKARTHFANREDETGLQILNSIPKGRAAYPFSRLILGIYLVNKKQNKEAIVALEAYCAGIKRNPPNPNDRFAVEEFQKGVAYLQHAYKQIGDTDKAVAVTDYLKILTPPKGKQTKVDRFKDTVFANQVRLDIAEQMKEEGKEGWKKAVEQALPPLSEILMDPDDPTVFTIMAANEKLKALVLLEKFEEAEYVAREWKAMTRSLDSEFEKADLLHEAPSAKMYLWIAEMNLAKAAKETDKTKRIELNSKAITDFYRVFTSYDSKLCPYIPAAAKGFNKAKLALQEDGKEVTAEVEPPVNFEFDRANTLYNNASDLYTKALKLEGEEKAKKMEEAEADFKKAVAVILKVLRSEGGKNSENSVDLLSKLTDCYIKTGKILEAMTIAGFMADCFPDSPNTPLFLLQLGEINWKKFKKSPETPEGQKAKELALMVYGWYTENCPTHKYASDIAAKIAMEYYAKAAAMAEKANNMPDGPGEIGKAKLKANMEAREEFKNVIPKFKNIVDNYSHTKRGKEAAFIMANCYSNALLYLKGSEEFEKYCELETNHPKKNEREMGRVADAKFRMADNYVKYAENLNEEADALKKDLEEAPESVEEGSDQKTKADIRKIIEEKNAEANKYFNLAIKNFREFTGKWVKPGGRLYGLTGNEKKKVEDLVSHTIAYIPWVYDRAGDQDKTILAFTEFLKKFPDHKSAPSALKRRAFIYISKEDTQKAAKDFDTLSKKYPDKAKTIQFDLAKAMYEIKNYNKSIEAVKKLFEGDPEEIKVPQLRWIARKLIDCGGNHPKEGAVLALQASKLLLARLKNPVLSEWVTKQKIAEMEADETKRKNAFQIIKDQILLIAADAAYYSEEYQQAIKYLDDILSDENTPYFYSAHYKRGELYRKLKQYKEALKDYAEIANVLVANPGSDESMIFKTQVLVGMTYIELGQLGKATAAMAAPAMSVISDKDLADLNKKEVSEEEEKLQKEYAEYALYLTACCEKQLGNTEKAESLVKTYRKAFPNGKIKNKISDIKQPEQAIKDIKIEVF